MALNKIFTLIIVLSIFILPTSALQEKATVQSSVIAPQWSEFCPEQYLDARIRPLNEARNYLVVPYCTSTKKWVKRVNAILILPAFDCRCAEIYWENKISQENQVIAYWLKRKSMFEASVATCASAPIEQQAGCYMQVRQLELQRQQIAVQNMQVQLQSINSINQSIQMQNINNNLNNINSNLNRVYY